MFKGIIPKGGVQEFAWGDFSLRIAQNPMNDLFSVYVTRHEAFYLTGQRLWNASSITSYNLYGAGTVEVARDIGYGTVPCNKLDLLLWTGVSDEHYTITIYINRLTRYVYVTVQYTCLDNFGTIHNGCLPFYRG